MWISIVIFASTYRYIGRSLRTVQPRGPTKVATLRPPGAICRYKRHFDRHRPGHQQIQWQTIQEKKKSLAPPTRQDKTKQDKAGQIKTGQGKERQGKAGRDNARQDKAEQGRARQGDAGQGKARQDRAMYDKVRQGRARTHAKA